MNKAYTKIVSSALAALMVGGLAMSMTAPAQAGPFKIPTKIYPFPKPIVTPPPVPTPTPGPSKSGGWGKGGGFGWGLGGVATGLALGEIASQASVYDACGYVHQRIYDQYGNFIGYRNVPTC